MSTVGKNINEVEKITATTSGVKYAVALSCGTESIHNPKEKNPLEGKKVVFAEDENDKTNADGVKGHLEAVGDVTTFLDFMKSI